ncbi:MAG: MGMT family protein [Leptospiraceae bacterium]|nr:MGMT family protein [Leptospiraceae bacterium]MDW7975348.1 MGMT family protein [Leptospiraceae bacterium]
MIYHYHHPPVFLEIEIAYQNEYFIKKIRFLKETKEIQTNPLDQHQKKFIKVVVEYFHNYFHHLPLKNKPNFILEGTEFQIQVWKELNKIPMGEVVSYEELAVRAGFSKSYARAVGQACRKNPIPILIPCHRVIGKNESLVGFAGGIEIKKWLLKHENAKISKKN